MKIPKGVWGWAFYDFANSAYLLAYSSFLLPVFFSTVLLQQGYTLQAWGWVNGISTVIGVTLAMIIGRLADIHGRYRLFAGSIVLSFCGMLVVSLTAGFHQFWLPLSFVVANSAFILSLALSDSILPHVAERESSYAYSGFAWGFGYLGGVGVLLIVLPLQKLTGEYSFSVFVSVAIFYLLFSLVSLRGLRGVPLNAQSNSQSRRRLSVHSKFLLLFGYWLVSECITVVMLFYSIFLSTEMHLSSMAIAKLLFLVQLVAFPATWIGGILAARYQGRRVLGATVIFWGLAILLLVFPLGTPGLVSIAILGGLAIGNSQSILRAQYATLIEKSESGFQFGMYSLISEGAVFIGPIVYGYASDVLGSQRIPLVALFALMVLGYAIIRWVTRQTMQRD